MKKSRIIIITVIITLVVVFLLGGIISSKSKDGKKATIVRLEHVQRGELVEIVTAPGEVEPKKKVDISAKVSARIIELPYDEGDTVICGDPKATPAEHASVLVRLDSKDLESNLKSAQAAKLSQAAQIEVEKANILSLEASLAGNEASLKQAENDYIRKNGLLESKDISQAAFDECKSNYERLKADFASAKHSLESTKLNLVVMQHNLDAAVARVEQAEEALSYTIISSPIDGVVTRLNAEIGELVMTGTMNNPGTVILQVADLSQMLVVAQVDEADIGKLKVGQKALVRIQAFPGEKFTGVVDSIALTHDISSTGTKYYRTEILLDNSKAQLYSGLTADVDIEVHKYMDMLKVPTQAVLGRPVDDLPKDIRENCPDKDKTFAVVVYRCIDNKAVVTPVTIGPADMTHTVILSGLKDEEAIVVGPYKILESLSHNQQLKGEEESEKAPDANNIEIQPKTDTNSNENG